jgi:hypothetical protein
METLIGKLVSSTPFKSGRPIILDVNTSPIGYVLTYPDDKPAIKTVCESLVNTNRLVQISGTVEPSDFLPYLHVEMVCEKV